MIFVTVGTQLPFDRLIGAVDAWAATRPGREVFAQIGPSQLQPQHLDFAPFVAPAECDARMAAATAVVAHAGMGTILTALQLGKPVVVLPRRAALGEHRNDHQLATARRFATLGGVTMVEDEQDLPAALDALSGPAGGEPLPPHASPQLLDAVRAFIAT